MPSLPENLRDEFRKPLGTLVADSDVTKDAISHEIQDKMLVTVGDATSEKLMRFGMMPLLQIVDGKEKRIERKIPESDVSLTQVRCENPPGTINPDCIDVIRECLSSDSPIRLTISGEEDLLVIPVCMYALDGTVVMYGQPNEGLVIVHVDALVRDKAKSLLDMMKNGV